MIMGRRRRRRRSRTASEPGKMVDAFFYY